MKPKVRKIIIASSIFLALVASGTAYYKFIYKKEIKKNHNNQKSGGKTNDNGGKTSKTDNKKAVKL